MNKIEESSRYSIKREIDIVDIGKFIIISLGAIIGFILITYRQTKLTENQTHLQILQKISSLSPKITFNIDASFKWPGEGKPAYVTIEGMIENRSDYQVLFEDINIEVFGYRGNYEETDIQKIEIKALPDSFLIWNIQTMPPGAKIEQSLLYRLSNGTPCVETLRVRLQVKVKINESTLNIYHKLYNDINPRYAELLDLASEEIYVFEKKLF